MSINQTEAAERMGRAVAGAMHEHWGLFLAEGIILVILGVIAIVVPQFATLAFTILIGWLFFVAGVVGLFTTAWMRGAPGFWWSLVSAIVAIAAGVVLLLWPVNGTLSLTLVLIAFFIVEGGATILYAVDHRDQLSGRWGWMLVSGIIDIILAAIILTGLPGTASWALGLLVGINMVFGGAALIAMAMAARNPTSAEVDSNVIASEAKQSSRP
ncbi:MAG: HdeD family acid-resistance protein [Xanthobacteraceae bacterium]